MNCRFCNAANIFKFLDLGDMALANSFLTEDQLSAVDTELKFPLDVYFCEQCGLVQIGYIVPPEILFRNYIYYSATSDFIHNHARYLAQNFKHRFNLSNDSMVVEIASNDGTILKCFKAEGFNVLGIEPAANIAKVAVDAGIPTVNDFFSESSSLYLKECYGKADLILGRHVFAHVPEIHGFVKGLKSLLAESGVVAIEAPYLIDFVERTEFDTIYHEHYSYLSVRAMSYLFRLYDMEVFDVEKVAIHGGSLIYYVGHQGAHPMSDNVGCLIQAELDKGLGRSETYATFARRALKLRVDILDLLRELKSAGKRVAAYGAPAKGNTFLNYCGITTDLVQYTVDKSPYKQNLYTPGMHLPVFHPDKLIQDMPDYVLLLAWNFADEILDQQHAYLRNGGKFIQAIPEVGIL